MIADSSGRTRITANSKISGACLQAATKIGDDTSITQFAVGRFSGDDSNDLDEFHVYADFDGLLYQEKGGYAKEFFGLQDGAPLKMFPEDVTALSYDFTAEADGRVELADSAGLFEHDLPR